MKLTIEVTKEDIDQGIRGNACLCPIARAINRVAPSAQTATVHAKKAFLVRTTGGVVLHALLPFEATLFVEQFDRSSVFDRGEPWRKPFSFDLTFWDPFKPFPPNLLAVPSET